MKRKNNFKWVPLFVTNFLGVFNDNFLKILVCYIAVTWMNKDNEGIIRALASAMLVVPYILFSPLAGRMSKVKKKVLIVRVAKFAEIPIMLLATLGFVIQSAPLLIFCIFLMGVQSALFSPAKYGLIRDVGGDKGLSFGTGSMEMLTFLGIILATLAAGLVSDYYSYPWVMPFLCGILLLIAVLGWVCSRRIKVQESRVDEESNDSINPIIFIKDAFNWARTVRGLNFVVLGLCGFWFMGSMLQLLLISYCGNVLHMDGFHTSIVVTCSALGIGSGCYLAGVLSRHHVNLRLVLVGGIGAVVSLFVIYSLSMSGWTFLDRFKDTPSLITTVFSALIFTTGCFGGLHEVPLNAWVQKNVLGRQLGDALAYINITTFVFMSVGAVIYGLIDDSGQVNSAGHINYLFLIMAAVMTITTCVMYFRVPGMRFKKKS